MSKSISFKLHQSAEAARKVREYAADINLKQHKLVKQLTDSGAEIARTEVIRLGAAYTNELHDSIEGYYNPQNNVGIIYAGAWYAVYVEFGTGIVGKRSPHPNHTGWDYDSKNHGDSGWWYFNHRDNQWHWTAGYKSRPFMYNTLVELERISYLIAKNIFSGG